MPGYMGHYSASPVVRIATIYSTERMLPRYALLIVIGVFSLMPIVNGYGQDASPVLCRDALRPLLLQSSPDPELLHDAQRLCAGQAVAGDPDALYQQSLLHLGLIDWQPDKAIVMIRSAAQSGISEAQYWLAWQHEAGPLLDNDAEQALHWYLRAGEQEHRLALSRLAGIYANGELGTSVDAQKASLYRARVAQCRN
ncbi:MAG: hypothetical protein QGG54_03505 [Gammaproteobacteria bacterium]|nr:hypothetical protein [Chromatiales bacterium]MDP6414084.1 hypothetical protein [Gammaproteobacteria bacterium]